VVSEISIRFEDGKAIESSVNFVNGDDHDLVTVVPAVAAFALDVEEMISRGQ
jgi:hypothetical protein